jgi:hypothetical protein
MGGPLWGTGGTVTGTAGTVAVPASALAAAGRYARAKVEERVGGGGGWRFALIPQLRGVTRRSAAVWLGAVGSVPGVPAAEPWQCRLWACGFSPRAREVEGERGDASVCSRQGGASRICARRELTDSVGGGDCISLTGQSMCFDLVARLYGAAGRCAPRSTESHRLGPPGISLAMSLVGGRGPARSLGQPVTHSDVGPCVHRAVAWIT